MRDIKFEMLEKENLNSELFFIEISKGINYLEFRIILSCLL